LLTEALGAAQVAGQNDFDSQEALFAVVAWTDEVLLAAPWSGAQEWARHLLQKRHFGVSNAGDAFFSHLEQLGPQQIEVREVYIYCLSMGFAGRYGYDRNAKALDDIKQSSLLQVLSALRAQREGTGLSSEMEEFMFPDGYALGSATEADKDTRQSSRWAWKFSALTINMLLIPLIVLCVLYGIYHLIIWQLVNALLVQLK
jgi:type VI secretion system protein ImpK